MSKSKKVLKNTDNINYTLLINKDGLYDWRPITIIHPLLYVSFINLITENKNWNEITQRFELFQQNKQIQCISIPIISTGKKTDKSETILNWWENLEQASIKYALDYKYCVKTDVTNCYGSIYTHSIAWAMMGKEAAKQHHDAKNQLGNKIDATIQEMQYGQTNGIPQGGPLFDLIAEIVLGYSDLCLSNRLKANSITDDFKILRYRDDYRIFTNSKEVAHSIVKELADVLSELNMHFNSKKTLFTTNIIDTAIKKDKRFWTKQREIVQTKKDNKISYHLSLQKHLLTISDLSTKFPNSGSLTLALQEFIARISSKNIKLVTQLKSNAEVLISILVSILIQSPKVVPQIISAISIILKEYNDDIFSKRIVNQIIKKLSDTPNVGYVYVWLQRLTITNSVSDDYSEPLCDAIKSSKNSIWDSSWLDKEDDYSAIVNREIIKSLSSEITLDEIDTFSDYN